jgi:hypothetical protein
MREIIFFTIAAYTAKKLAVKTYENISARISSEIKLPAAFF